MAHGLRKHIKSWLQGVEDILFPPLCLVCGAEEAGKGIFVCSSCRKSVTYISSPLCESCGRSMSESAGGDHLCGRCLRDRPAYSTARGIVHYQAPVSDLLHRLKYQGDTSVLPALQRVVKDRDIFSLLNEDRIVPVPLHLKRLRSRGFNQALLLAEMFFPDHRRQILVNGLQRVRHTVPQTGLDGRARRKNLHNAFAVPLPGALAGRRVVLIDDVFTTGTTVNECSRVLLRAGVSEVHALTLARVKEE